MGCDIHWHVEKRNAAGIWELAFPPHMICYRDEHDEAVEEGYRKPFVAADWPGVTVVESWEEGEFLMSTWEEHFNFTEDLYVKRQYNLFAMLADCGRGSFKSITGENRGIPDDISNAYLFAVTGGAGLDPETGELVNDVGGHSHNWVTLDELLAVDWDTEHHEWGIVGTFEFLRYELDGVVHSRSHSWNETTHKTYRSNEEMRQLPEVKTVLDLLPDLEVARAAHALTQRDRFSSSDYTRLKWKVPYRAHCTAFIDKTIPALTAMAEGDTSSIRCVYFFTN